MQKIGEYIKNLLLVLVVIVIFTGIDYLAHQLRPEFGVPSYYFRNKIIFGFILGAIIYFLIRRMQNPVIKSFLFSIIIATLLQTRYTIEGYDFFGFVLPFLFIHFFILWPISYLILFRKSPI